MSRRAHGGHHGGSWKVAFADFMTALFCLFLVMWLINLSPKQKEGVSYYFKNYSIFKPNSGTISIVKLKDDSGKSKVKEDSNQFQKMSDKDLEKIEKNIKEKFKKSPEILKNNIVFEKTDEGLRINLIDNEGDPMFEVGSKLLTSKGEGIIDNVAKEIVNYDAAVVIEGHTDSLEYARQDYTNWELSTERALTARKQLEKNGFTSKRIEKITGFADTQPLIKEDSYDSRNRRISILIKK